MTLKDYKVDNIQQKGVQSLSNNPSDAGMSAEALKKAFDGLVENETAPKYNGLIDCLESDKGSKCIGSEPISGVQDPDDPLIPAGTVHKQLRSIQKNVGDIIGGIIPDGSISSEKLSEGAVIASKVADKAIDYTKTSNILPTYIVAAPPGDELADAPIGSTAFIPQVTLHNLINNPRFTSTDGWSIFNATGSAAEGALVMTGGNGAKKISASQDVVKSIDESVVYGGVSIKVNSLTGLVGLRMYILSNVDLILISEKKEGIEPDVFFDLYGQITVNKNATSPCSVFVEAEFDSSANAQDKIVTIMYPVIINETVDFSTILRGGGGY